VVISIVPNEIVKLDPEAKGDPPFKAFVLIVEVKVCVTAPVISTVTVAGSTVKSNALVPALKILIDTFSVAV
jgi:hypothetical protein